MVGDYKRYAYDILSFQLITTHHRTSLISSE